MTVEEAVAKLDALETPGHRDSEGSHSEADDILLAVVPVEVREAYERVQDRADGWWFA
jgi:hypothetical protein